MQILCFLKSKTWQSKSCLVIF